MTRVQVRGCRMNDVIANVSVKQHTAEGRHETASFLPSPNWLFETLRHAVSTTVRIMLCKPAFKKLPHFAYSIYVGAVWAWGFAPWKCALLHPYIQSYKTIVILSDSALPPEETVANANTVISFLSWMSCRKCCNNYNHTYCRCYITRPCEWCITKQRWGGRGCVCKDSAFSGFPCLLHIPFCLSYLRTLFYCRGS